MFSKDKKCSFIIPVYKAEKTIEKCVKSLLDQDYENYEIIAVLDGPGEKEKEILRQFKKVKVLEIEHGGAPKARNVGAKIAKGDYLSFWDADCYAEPGMLRVWMMAFKKFPDIDFVYSGYRFVTQGNQTEGIEAEQFNPWLLKVNNYIATMFPIKREKFPGFDESLKSLQDWDMWLSVVEKGGKGLKIEGYGFSTEYPTKDSISGIGCSRENWLGRVKAVKKKHNIPMKDICVSSVAYRDMGIELAKILDADFMANPSFNVHEYKLIYLLGFFSVRTDLHTQIFSGSGITAKKVIHWIGRDTMQLLNMPYVNVIGIRDWINKHGIKCYCQDTLQQKNLKKVGIEAEIQILPCEFGEITDPKDFKVVLESDAPYEVFSEALIKALPDLKIERKNNYDVREYSVMLRFSESKMIDDVSKKALVYGVNVLSNIKAPYTGYVSENDEIPKIKARVIEKIREFQKSGKRNLKAAEYYRKIYEPEGFKRRLNETFFRNSGVQ